ncbi:UDP-N-acetylmuramyl tripeptide synthetase [Candidatus Magnetoovum chiemensis]|nr:UDP-N-acetylmuramyl tripeptide synthetase [Candidatus Magnetoovum chiemensis]
MSITDDRDINGVKNMNFSEVLKTINVKEIKGDFLREIPHSICYDSRNAGADSMFFAIKGERTNGHSFIADAINRGARIIIYDEDITTEHYQKEDVLFIKVEDARLALAHISAAFFGEPTKDVKLIGITGTNGKTTTSYIIKNILDSNSKKVGLIGTIKYIAGDKIYDAHHTTPEAPDFQKLVKDMKNSGCEYVISEVSSHALHQRRVDASSFDAAVFTNLSRDHLDYHNSMESYYNAKKRLFTELIEDKGAAVINTDDEYGKRLVKEISNRKIITYGIDSQCDVKCAKINASKSEKDCKKPLTGMSFIVRAGNNTLNISSNLRGYVNIYNILAAIATAIHLKAPIEVIEQGVNSLKSVKGRFEAIDCGQDFSVIVDYAHTDDALRNLLESIRKVYCGKIILVFGCGGNRDVGKRYLMGKAAASLSDFTIITSDNPRNEEPMAIIKQIQEGFSLNQKQYIIEPDRKTAIKKALNSAKTGDMVVVAGKGHENYQEIKGVKYPFDDRDVIEKLLKKQ